MNGLPAFFDRTEFTLAEAQSACGQLEELGFTEEVSAATERFARKLSRESASAWQAALEKKISHAVPVWLRGCLHAQTGDMNAAADAWASLQWTTEGSGRAPLLLALAGALVKAGRGDEAWAPLAGAASVAASARQLRQVDRILREAVRAGLRPPSKRQCRIALVSNFTIDLLQPLLRAQCWGAGIDATFYVAPFNQIVQEIQDPQSGLAIFRPDVVVIAPDWRWLEFADEEPDPPLALARRLAQIEGLWNSCRDRLSAFTVQFGFEIPLDEPWGRLSMALGGGRARMIQQLNLALWEAAAKTAGLAILDVEQMASQFGKARWSDAVLWQVAKQYPAPDALAPLGREITALLRGVYGLTAKCVVLDLDGTLWGGVIGEDGLNGIQLGGSAVGESFSAFQRYLKSLSQRGILLAACSKNNEEDARRPFREHPEMVLRESDFACFAADWRPKHENIRDIARTINIGTDALVFVDDNPVERATVRRNLPDVEVVEMPAEPARYVSALAGLKLFETLSLTAEDRARTHSIQGNMEREQLAAAAGNVDDYLAGLGIRVQLAPFDDVNMPRIVQLINKTNQFNLTTRRRTEADVRSLPAGSYTQAMRVTDRFGDSGLTGILIAIPDGGLLRLDTWLMSCRVMGRKLEEAMFAALTAHACSHGFAGILCEYIPSAKNSVVADLFDRLGCVSVDRAGESRFYHWSGAAPRPLPAVLEVHDLTARESSASRV